MSIRTFGSKDHEFRPFNARLHLTRFAYAINHFKTNMRMILPEKKYLHNTLNICKGFSKYFNNLSIDFRWCFGWTKERYCKQTAPSRLWVHFFSFMISFSFFYFAALISFVFRISSWKCQKVASNLNIF